MLTPIRRRVLLTVGVLAPARASRGLVRSLQLFEPLHPPEGAAFHFRQRGQLYPVLSPDVGEPRSLGVVQNQKTGPRREQPRGRHQRVYSSPFGIAPDVSVEIEITVMVDAVVL